MLESRIEIPKSINIGCNTSFFFKDLRTQSSSMRIMIEEEKEINK